MLCTRVNGKCQFSFNEGHASGGGIYNDGSGGKPEISNSSFCKNIPQAISGNYTDKGHNSLNYCTNLRTTLVRDASGIIYSGGIA